MCVCREKLREKSGTGSHSIAPFLCLETPIE
jgi:hypothetical protein